MTLIICLLLAYLTKAVVSDPLTAAENEHRLKTCGKKPSDRAHKMMNSHLVSPKKVPWIVAINYVRDEKSQGDRFNGGTRSCSGTVISSRHVVTAASCFLVIKQNLDWDRRDRQCANGTGICYDFNHEELEIKKFKLLFHANSGIIGSGRKTDAVDTIGVKRVFMPRIYRNREMSDVAVIELERDIAELLPGRVDNTIAAACVWDDKREGVDGPYLYGYGDDEKMSGEKYGLLQRIIFPYAKPCNYGRFGESERTDEFCWMTPDNRHGCMDGDNGAGAIHFRSTTPEQVRSDTRYYVIAVHSQMLSCPFFEHSDLNGTPDITIRLFPKHVKWICRKTGICPTGHSAHPNPLPDDLIEVLETGGQKYDIYCNDAATWSFYGQAGLEQLCYSFIEYPRGHFNYEGAKKKCKDIGGEIAPVRNQGEWEQIINFAEKVLELDDGLIFVGAELDPRVNRLRWTFDNSLVSLDPRLWKEGNPSGVYGKGEEYEIPETVMTAFFDPKDKSKKELMFDDVSREYDWNTRGVICAKKPTVENY